MCELNLVNRMFEELVSLLKHKQNEHALSGSGHMTCTQYNVAAAAASAANGAATIHGGENVYHNATFWNFQIM